MTNFCPHPIWIGQETKTLSSSTSNQYDGYKLDIGQEHVIKVPKSIFSTRIWGRTAKK